MLISSDGNVTSCLDRQGQKAVTCEHVTLGAEVWDGGPDMWQGGWRREGSWLGQEAQNYMKSMGVWNLDPHPPQFTPLSYLYVLLWSSYLSEPQSLPLENWSCHFLGLSGGVNPGAYPAAVPGPGQCSVAVTFISFQRPVQGWTSSNYWFTECER